MVSKIFTISRENTTRNVLRFNKPEKSNLQKIGDISCGAETGNQWSGNTVTPNGIPINVVAIMPQNNEPLTLRAISTPLSKVAKIPNKHGVVNSPNPTNVPSFATIMPAFLSPIKAINIPIPAEIAYRKLLGIALNIISRTLKNVININITPSISKIASEFCHE